MRKFSDLQPTARLYVSTIVLVGLILAAHSAIVGVLIKPVDPEWLILAVLTLLTGSFTIKVPSITARLTVSETFVFSSVLLFGVAAGTLTVVLETLVVALWVKRESRAAYRALFNVAASALSIWLAGTVSFWVSGLRPLSHHETPLGSLFLPLATLTVIFFVANSWLVAIAVGLEKHTSPLEIWWKNFTWLSVNYFSGASVAAVIVTYSSQFTSTAFFGTLVVIVPLLVVSYLTFRTAMGRVEDSNLHLRELNRLYLSTIETLAMAIDAKDQITHGHIRRVQLYAVGLAKHLGVVDANLIKAIEAAALLHDMGKLAVPEYILNKPGKLTPAEFEKMKLHASVGADILSAIEFPYPVVPIVRHHHENWDGSGYPIGLKATDIPIGARILSVVDCFDALTSDRPYRPRLSDEDALAILRERRGSMYDPLIVDAFIAVYADIRPRDASLEPSRQRLGELKVLPNSLTPGSSIAPLDDITAGADEMLTLFELSRALAGQASVSDTADVIAKHLHRLIPSSLSVFFHYDSDKDDLEAIHAVGDSASLVIGIRIPFGQRLSGWVGANRRTIINSDPTLDLGEVVKLPRSPRLRSCLSTALTVNDALVGVLTLYSTNEAFGDDHRRIIELIAPEIAVTFRRALEFEDSHRRDATTGLPTAHQLQQFVNLALQSSGGHRVFTLVRIQVTNFADLSRVHGRHFSDEVLRHVVGQTRTALRFADLLFRGGSDSFIALLADTPPENGERIAESIRRILASSPLSSPNGMLASVDIHVMTVPFPAAGQTLLEVLHSVSQTDANHQQILPRSSIH